MKTLFVFSAFLLLSSSAVASDLDASVFTDTVFRTLGRLDPRSQPCPYNLVIKRDQSDLSFFSIEYGSTSEELMFTVSMDTFTKVMDKPTQKRFVFEEEQYKGSAYYSHRPENPNPFYEIMIHRSKPFMICRYSIIY